MKRLIKNRKSQYLLIIVVVDLLFFGLTDPSKVPSVLLVAGFVLLIATFYLAFSVVLEAIDGGDEVLPKRNRNIVPISTAVLAFVIAMQSIGQLSIRDLLAVIPLAVLFLIYSSYLTKKS